MYFADSDDTSKQFCTSRDLLRRHGQILGEVEFLTHHILKLEKMNPNK